MKAFLGRLELLFRHTVVYPSFRLILRNKPRALPLEVADISSVLILRYDKLGDMIVSLPIFRILKKRNPSLRIGVLTSESNLEILEGETTVDDRYVLYRNPVRLLRELRRVRGARYQVVLNFIFNRTTSGGLIANYVCPQGIKIGQGAEKYRFYFNAMVSLPRASSHMVEILVCFIEQVFGIRVVDDEKRLQMTVEPGTTEVVDRFLLTHGLRRRTDRVESRRQYVVLNVSAREWNKRISQEQGAFLAGLLAKLPHMTTVVTAAPEDAAMRDAIVRGLGSDPCISFPDKGKATMHEMASLLGGAICVVTPDTSIVHLASSMNTPVLGLFTPLLVNQEWLPYRTESYTVVAPAGQPVSAISVETLESAVRQFVAPMVRQGRQGGQD